MSNPCAYDLFRVHGGRITAARAVFGGEDWLDLSTGIAPWAWPCRFEMEALKRLPEPEEISLLESVAARAFDVSDARQVVAVPGTDIAMRLIAPIIAAKNAAVVQPGYSGHRASWPDATPVSGINDPALDGRDMLVLASPRNPDGMITDPEELYALSGQMRVVVDEAYADPHPGLCAKTSDRLIVLRSFGKFYGLPGLRLGFVVAGYPIVGQLRDILGDWPVSSLAVRICTKAYGDRAWQEAQQQRILSAGTLMDELLHKTGLQILGSAPLFRLVYCDRATQLFEILARHAILVRPFRDAPDHLRFGLPRDIAAHARLAKALEEFGK